MTALGPFAFVLVLLCTSGLEVDASSGLKAGDDALAQGHFTAAIKAYSAALEKDTASALILGKRGSAYLVQGALSEALNDFNAAVGSDPSSHGTLLKRAKLLRQLGRVEEAAEDIGVILAKRPNHKAALKEKSILTELNKLWAQMDDPRNKQSKRALISKILDASPSCRRAKTEHARQLLADNDFGGVVVMTGQILKQDSADTAALCLRGNAHFNLGDMQLAKKHFSEALRSDPDHAEAKTWFKALKGLMKLLSEAEDLKKSNDNAKAEERYLEAVVFTGLPEVYLQAFWWEICKLRFKLERPAPSVEACEYIARVWPDNEDAVTHLVKSLIMDKQFAAASRVAGTARRKWQSSRSIYELYREAEMAQKMSERKQFYEVLNISKQSSDVEIKRAYRDLARRFHPDKASSEGLTVEAAQERFMQIIEAYEVLSDPEQRRAYDEGRDLRVGSGQAGGGFPHPGFQGFGGFPGGFQHSYHFQFG